MRTDALASPTGFPFKVVQLPGTVSEPATYEARTRICDLGYLRQPYRTADGKVGYRCPAEPIEDYVKKGGKIEDTVGRKCICNGLIATVGMGQVRKGGRARDRHKRRRCGERSLAPPGRQRLVFGERRARLPSVLAQVRGRILRPPAAT